MNCDNNLKWSELKFDWVPHCILTNHLGRCSFLTISNSLSKRMKKKRKELINVGTEFRRPMFCVWKLLA